MILSPELRRKQKAEIRKGRGDLIKELSAARADCKTEIASAKQYREAREVSAYKQFQEHRAKVVTKFEKEQKKLNVKLADA